MGKKFLSMLLSVLVGASFLGTSSQAKVLKYEKVNSNTANITEKEGSNSIGNIPRENRNRYGEKELTPKIKSWKKKNITEVKSAGLNSLGSERITEGYTKGLKTNSYTNERIDFNENIYKVVDSQSLPSEVDNSKLDAFPGIGDQEDLSSCSSFVSAYYAMSHMVNLMEGKSGKSNQNRFSPKWAYNMVNDGLDAGSSIEENYAAIRSVGVVTLEDVPYLGLKIPETNYRSWELNASTWKKAQRYSIEKLESTNLQHISNPKDTNLDVIKTELANGYLLNYVTYWNACNWAQIKDDININKDDEYVGEIICKYNSTKTTGCHAVTVVGYNDDIWNDINENGVIDQGEKGAIKIANSWGINKGNKGFYWISYDALNEISAVPNNPLSNNSRKSHFRDSEVMWFTPSILSEEPKLYAEFKLNSLKRNQCEVKLNARDIVTNGTYSFSPYQFEGDSDLLSKGGEYGFSGTEDAVDGTFIVDLTKVIKDITPEKLKSYEWTLEVTDNKGDSNPLKVKEYKIVDEINDRQYSANIENPILVDGNTSNISIKNYEDLSFKEIKIDKPSPSLVGSEINISAEVSGGSGSRQYTYIIESMSGETIEVIKENTPESSITWIPKDVQTCFIKIDVIDTITGEKEAMDKCFVINGPMNIGEFSTDGGYTKPVGSKISFNTVVTGGAGHITWSYRVILPEAYSIAENAGNSFISWIPRTAGNYLIEVMVRDESGNCLTKLLKYKVTEKIGEVSKPTDFNINLIEGNKVELTWSAPKTTIGSIDGYDIYCDGVQVNRVSNERCIIYLNKESHKYTVMAFNTEGIYSEMSYEIIVPEE